MKERLLAIALLTLVACSKQGKDGADNADEKPDKSWGKCKYLSVKDASKITGHTMENAGEEDSTNSDSSSCKFESEESDKTVVKIELTVYQKGGIVWDGCKKGAKVSGIDDEARDMDGRVCVKKGDTVATVYSMVYGIEKDEQEQVTRRLAKRVSLKLK